MIASLPWIRKMNSNSCLSTPPARAVSGPPWLGLSVLLLAGFVTIFDLFVVNVAIPSMQADLDANFAQIGFIVAGYELAFGVLLMALGIVTLTHPGETIGFLCVVYGILVLSDGLFKVQIAVDAKRFGIDRWWAILLAAACAGVLGVLLVLRPGEGAQALTMLLGASLFLDGVMNLLVALLTVKIIRHQQPDVIETDEFEIK